MTASLVSAGRIFINFKNHTYQWVDIRKFHLPETEASDVIVLTKLIDHELYGDNYASGEFGEDPERHGPYWRNRITPDCFDATAAEIEETVLRTWAEQYAPLSGPVRTALDRELYQPLRASGRLYRLRDLGSVAFHDWGGVQIEFHELVLINRATSTLHLAVAADD